MPHYVLLQLVWCLKPMVYHPLHLMCARTGIRLAGATNDVHVFDARVGRWEKIVPQGEAPSPRAAHAAAAVGNMVVIQVHAHTSALLNQLSVSSCWVPISLGLPDSNTSMPCLTWCLAC